MRYVALCSVMSVKQLLRNRVAVLLFAVIPTLFSTVIVLITPERTILLQLPTVEGEPQKPVEERDQSVVFIGFAAVCLLTAFLALHLIQKTWEIDRRLVVAGYKPSELLISKLSVLIGVILLTSVYAATIVRLFLQPQNYWPMVAGFMCGGFVYGCYGLFVGSLVKRDLEGVLCVILLSNIDASWLQNPIIYSGAQQKEIIRSLPGFYPAQATMTGALTDYSMLPSVVGALIFGSAFLLIVLVVYALRMRIHR